MAEDSADALVSALHSLHPDSEVSIVRGRGRERSPDTVFLMLPNRASARMAVPASPPSAAARSVRRFSADSRYADTARRLAVSALARAHRGTAFPDRIVVRGDRDRSLAGHLDELLGTRVSFSVGVGTARVNRKPVLQVFGPDGRTRAFAKIGDSDQARSDIATEAAALERLADRAWSRLEIPRVLHHGSWRDLSVLLLSPLSTSARPSLRAAHEAPKAAMAELATAYGVEEAHIGELPWLGRQRELADSLGDRRRRAAFLGYLDRVHEIAGDVLWRVGCWHGDWTPWNMARAGRRVRVWDWERFERDVPVGLDRCHYLVNAATKQQGTSPATIEAGLLAAGANPGPGSRGQALGALYLLAMAGRYLPLAEGPRGEDIAERGDVVLATLEEWLNPAA